MITTNTAIDGDIPMNFANSFELYQRETNKRKSEWVYFEKFERGKLF